MFRFGFLLAAFCLVAASANAQTIRTLGVGQAQAEASRAILNVRTVETAEQARAGEELRASLPGRRSSIRVLPRAEAIALIRQVDRSAREAPPQEPGRLRGVGQRLDPDVLRYEVASSAFDRLEGALAGMAHVYVPIADDPQALRQRALQAAISDAREKASVVAGAANMQLGDVVSIEYVSVTEPLDTITFTALALGEAPERPVSASATEMVQVVFAASPPREPIAAHD